MVLRKGQLAERKAIQTFGFRDSDRQKRKSYEAEHCRSHLESCKGVENLVPQGADFLGAPDPTRIRFGLADTSS